MSTGKKNSLGQSSSSADADAGPLDPNMTADDLTIANLQRDIANLQLKIQYLDKRWKLLHSAPLNKAENPEDAKPINLKVLGETDVVVIFKLKKQMQLKKLMDAYCIRVGLPIGFVEFYYGGSSIDETDTPMSLQMRDGDFIEAYKHDSLHSI